MDRGARWRRDPGGAVQAGLTALLQALAPAPVDANAPPGLPPAISFPPKQVTGWLHALLDGDTKYSETRPPAVLQELREAAFKLTAHNLLDHAAALERAAEELLPGTSRAYIPAAGYARLLLLLSGGLRDAVLPPPRGSQGGTQSEDANGLSASMLSGSGGDAGLAEWLVEFAAGSSDDDESEEDEEEGEKGGRRDAQLRHMEDDEEEEKPSTADAPRITDADAFNDKQAVLADAADAELPLELSLSACTHCSEEGLGAASTATDAHGLTLLDAFLAALVGTVPSTAAVAASSPLELPPSASSGPRRRRVGYTWVRADDDSNASTGVSAATGSPLARLHALISSACADTAIYVRRFFVLPACETEAGCLRCTAADAVLDAALQSVNTTAFITDVTATVLHASVAPHLAAAAVAAPTAAAGGAPSCPHLAPQTATLAVLVSALAPAQAAPTASTAAAAASTLQLPSPSCLFGPTAKALARGMQDVLGVVAHQAAAVKAAATRGSSSAFTLLALHSWLTGRYGGLLHCLREVTAAALLAPLPRFAMPFSGYDGLTPPELTAAGRRLATMAGEGDSAAVTHAGQLLSFFLAVAHTPRRVAAAAVDVTTAALTKQCLLAQSGEAPEVQLPGEGYSALPSPPPLSLVCLRLFAAALSAYTGAVDSFMSQSAATASSFPPASELPFLLPGVSETDRVWAAAAWAEAACSLLATAAEPSAQSAPLQLGAAPDAVSSAFVDEDAADPDADDPVAQLLGGGGGAVSRAPASASAALAMVDDDSAEDAAAAAAIAAEHVTALTNLCRVLVAPIALSSDNEVLTAAVVPACPASFLAPAKGENDGDQGIERPQLGAEDGSPSGGLAVEALLRDAVAAVAGPAADAGARTARGGGADGSPGGKARDGAAPAPAHSTLLQGALTVMDVVLDTRVSRCVISAVERHISASEGAEDSVGGGVGGGEGGGWGVEDEDGGGGGMRSLGQSFGYLLFSPLVPEVLQGLLQAIGGPDRRWLRGGGGGGPFSPAAALTSPSVAATPVGAAAGTASPDAPSSVLALASVAVSRAAEGGTRAPGAAPPAPDAPASVALAPRRLSFDAASVASSRATGGGAGSLISSAGASRAPRPPRSSGGSSSVGAPSLSSQLSSGLATPVTSSSVLPPSTAKPVFGAGYRPASAAQRSKWWDIDAQIDVKKEKEKEAAAAAAVAAAGKEDYDVGVLATPASAVAAPSAARPPLPPQSHQPPRRGSLVLPPAVGLMPAIPESDGDSGEEDMEDVAQGSTAFTARPALTDAQPAPVPSRQPPAASSPASPGAFRQSQQEQALSPAGSHHRLQPSSPGAPAGAPLFDPGWMHPERAWTAWGLGSFQEWEMLLAHARATPQAAAEVLALALGGGSRGGEGTATTASGGAPHPGLLSHPFTLLLQRAVHAPILTRHSVLTRAAVGRLMDDMCLFDHLWALRAVALLEQGQLMAGFTEPLFDALAAEAAPGPTPSTASAGSGSRQQRWTLRDSGQLTALLRGALGVRGPHLASKRRGPADLLADGIDALDVEPGVAGHVDANGYAGGVLDPRLFSLAFTGFTATDPDALVAAGLRLEYRAPYPLSLLLTPAVLAVYNRVWGQLLRVRRVVYALGCLHRESARVQVEARRLVTAGKLDRWADPDAPGTRALPAVATFQRQLHALQCHCTAVGHFLRGLDGHLSHAVLGLPWKVLTARLLLAGSVADIHAAHAAYLVSLERACLLGADQAQAAATLSQLVRRAGDFVSGYSSFLEAGIAGLRRVAAAVREDEAASRFLRLDTEAASGGAGAFASFSDSVSVASSSAATVRELRAEMAAHVRSGRAWMRRLRAGPLDDSIVALSEEALAGPAAAFASLQASCTSFTRHLAFVIKAARGAVLQAAGQAGASMLADVAVALDFNGFYTNAAARAGGGSSG